LLYSSENTSNSLGNLKSSNLQRSNQNINNNPSILNKTDSKESTRNNKNSNVVGLTNYTTNESCINNPSFLKFTTNSKFDYHTNEKLSNKSFYNEIQSIEEISNFYTKNLNLSKEEKLNIKNCIVMQIINSSTTTLNLGNIGVKFIN